MNKSALAGVFAADVRNEVRRPWERRARLRINGGAEMAIRTCDLSESGISIFSEAPILPGNHCALSMTVLHGERVVTMKLEGKSSSCILSGQRGYRVGIQIIEADRSVRTMIKQLMKLNN
jgi:hypothetical protein